MEANDIKYEQRHYHEHHDYRKDRHDDKDRDDDRDDDHKRDRDDDHKHDRDHDHKGKDRRHDHKSKDRRHDDKKDKERDDHKDKKRDDDAREHEKHELGKKIRACSDGLAGLGRGSHLEELQRIVHDKKCTSKSELAFVNAILDYVNAQASALDKLQADLVDAAWKCDHKDKHDKSDK